jgi:anti-sigma B factor antagonist
MFNATFAREDDELIATLEGRLDTLTSQDFERELEKTLTPDVHGLTIDTKDVEYISSAGLRTILAAQQYMEANDYRDVKVVNVNDVIMEIFDITGFSDILTIE